MTDTCHELQYTIWDRLLSTTIIYYWVKSTKMIQATMTQKKKKKRCSPLQLYINTHFLFFSSTPSPFSLSHFSLFLPFFLPSHFLPFTFSLPLKTHDMNNPLKLFSSLNLFKLHLIFPKREKRKKKKRSFIMWAWHGLTRYQENYLLYLPMCFVHINIMLIWP